MNLTFFISALLHSTSSPPSILKYFSVSSTPSTLATAASNCAAAHRTRERNTAARATVRDGAATGQDAHRFDELLRLGGDHLAAPVQRAPARRDVEERVGHLAAAEIVDLALPVERARRLLLAGHHRVQLALHLRIDCLAQDILRAASARSDLRRRWVTAGALGAARARIW